MVFSGDNDPKRDVSRDASENVIPKVLHCCWLGDRAKDALALKCRRSWERHASEFEIREWTSSDVETCGQEVPSFVRAAIKCRKWAFVADWLRFVALYLEGGVYFDYDFELLKPMGDLVAEGAFVAGEWLPDGRVAMTPAVVALEKGSPVAKAMLDHYKSAVFDGKTTVGEIMSACVSDHASSTLRLLPPEVFSPIDVNGLCHRTAETRGIHHYAMSWADPKRRLARWLSWHGMRRIVERLLKVRGWVHATCVTCNLLRREA